MPRRSTSASAAVACALVAAGAARVVTGDAAVAMREGTLSTVPPATEYAILPDGDEAITWEFFME